MIKRFQWSTTWWVSIIFLLILILLAACNDDTGTNTAVTAECNPTTIHRPTLPEFVEGIDYLGPEVHGPVHSPSVDGDRVYVGLGDSFAVLDVSNAAEPRLMGSTPLYGRTPRSGYNNFIVQDNVAYFFQVNDEYKVDVSNPEAPVLVRCRSDVPWPEAVEAFEGLYYIYNSSQGGIRITERVSPLATEYEVATYTTNTPPELEWNQPSGQLVPLPSFAETDSMYVRNYTFDDRYLYLIDVLRIPGDYCCGALTILDLKNPSEPSHISTTQLPAELSPFSVKVAEDFLFINLSEPRGYNQNVYIYDISNKRNPELLTMVPGFTLPQVHDGYAYFPNKEAIDIWELDGRDGPVLVGRIDIPGITDYQAAYGQKQMAFVGDYIYFAAGPTLAIINNEEPANPYLTDQVDFQNRPRVQSVAGGNGRLAGIDNGPLANGLGVLSLDDEFDGSNWLSLPEQQVMYDDIAVDGDYVFALEYDGVSDTNVHLFDLEGTEVTTATIKIEAFEGRRIAAVYPYVYVLQPTFDKLELKVMDISDTDNPVEVWNIGLAASVYQDLAVWEDSLYLSSTTDNGAVLRFDISEPDRPELVDHLPFNLLSQITVGDGFLFGLNLTSQIEVIDLRSEEGAVLVGRYDIERPNAIDLYYGDEVLYLALGDRGVAAVRLELPD
jgi:hypothetical protein